MNEDKRQTERERRKVLKLAAKGRRRGEDSLAQKERYQTLRELLSEVGRGFLTEYIPRERPDWPREVLIGTLLGSLETLRSVLEDPESGIDWRDPLAELRFPVDINPEDGSPRPLPVGTFPVTPAELTGETWERIRAALRKGSLEEPLLEKAGKDLVRFSEEALRLFLFEYLTKGAGLLKEGDEYTRAIAVEGFGPTPPEGVSEEDLEAFWVDRCKHFAFSAPDQERAITITGGIEQEPGEPKGFKATLVFEIHPLLIDLDKEEAFYSVLVGFVFEGEAADPSAWSEEDRRGFWKLLLSNLEGLLQEPKGETSETGTIEAPPAEKEKSLVPARMPAPVKPDPTRRLFSGPSLLDKRAMVFLSHASELSGLPRTWKSVQRWEDLVQAELERIQEELKEDAFKDLRQETGDTNARGPLLKRSYRSRTKEEVVSLTSEAEEALLESIGPKWLRRMYNDSDGVRREYLEKRLRAGSSFFTGRFSWYGQAWPLVEEGRRSEKEALSALEQRLRQGGLFENLSASDQTALDSRLRLMGSIRDAYRVMEAILATFGMDGENPLRMDAWHFYILLQCENDSHRFRRVRGCLRALQEIRFKVTLPGGSISGPFLADVAYHGRGPGRHRDGTFHLQVSPAFVGSLEVFRTSHYKVRNAQKILTYSWTKDLSKDGRKELGERGGFIRGLAQAPYWDKAKSLSYTQSNLRRWLLAEVTRNLDGIRRDRRPARLKPSHPKANEPRLYDRSFCPLLPEDRSYCGSLGHFRKNPECGRTLYGTSRGSTRTGGAHSEGLLSVMGHALPPGGAKRARAKVYRQALEDIQTVVESALGGVAAARAKDGEWLTLQEAARLPETALRRAAWFLFIPPDYEARMNAAIEEHHAERYARGETPWRVKVTREPPAPGEKVGPGTLPLHERLRVTRKERGLTQGDVAKLFGVSRPMVAQWEAGTEPDEDGKVRGKAISPKLVPLVSRWVETGEV